MEGANCPFARIYMPILLIQIITVVTNLIIFIAVIFYFLKVRSREKVLEEKERQVDLSYHHVVDEALAKERKILDDASSEASQIITDAKYINQAAKQAVDQALQKMAEEVKKGTQDSSNQFMASYLASLKQLSGQSVTNFQTITKELETDLQKQIKDFRESMLPRLEAELEAYKSNRIKEADQKIGTMVQKISRDVLNKSLTIEDHENLIIDALEKAKKEGIFG
jgi:hypothetical protein